MGRPKIHADHAARQRAYAAKRRMELVSLRQAVSAPLTPPEVVPNGTTSEQTRPDNRGYWYHFTAKKNLPSIFAEGIKPRGDRPANNHGEGLDSQSHLVYLTNAVLRPWHNMDYDNTCCLAITGSTS